MKRKGIGKVFKAKRTAYGERQRDVSQMQDSTEMSPVNLLRSSNSSDSLFFPLDLKKFIVFKSPL